MKRAVPAFKMRAIALMALGGGFALPTLASAQELAQASAPAEVAAADAAPEAAGDNIETVVVKARVNREVNILPNEDNNSVFGFDKSIKDTPRSITSISNEMLTKFNITELDDMVALTPGSFTQSFFGVAGSLDVRGTPGENYFRGVRRIDNPGNYPQPIGASDRIDIVRGPASPIYGPSKIGGYLNFVPKSARAQDGAYMKKPSGEFGVVRGSWDKDVIHGEVGGPGQLFGKNFGYYLYAETEDSGSYYENTSTDQSIYQASFDTDLSESTRIEFGGMYQEYEGNQVAGWNRLTQDLINHGTYITGRPASIDTDLDGQISAHEAGAANLSAFMPYGSTGQDWATALAAHPNMKLENPGTAKLRRSQVLVAPDDELTDKVATLYFDVIHDFGNNLKMVNKSFYESLKNNNENVYGFSQAADTWVFEDQLIFSFKHDIGDWASAAYQFSPSVRHQDFEHGSNFAYEYFDRRDITKPDSAFDRRTLSTRNSALEPWSAYYVGSYTDLGVALMTDFTVIEDLHITGGGRYDSIDMESTCTQGVDCTDNDKHQDTDDAVSWSVSISYDIPVVGMTPYFTRAKQSTMVMDQGGDIPSDMIASGTAVADSTLTEYGLKGSFWDNRIYASVSNYKQQRLDYSAQNTVTNNTTEGKGWEAELRAVVTNNIALSATYSKTEVYNLTAAKNGGQFSFLGAGDLPTDIDPSTQQPYVTGADIFGGVAMGIVPTKDGRKQGVPENIYSLYLIYSFDGTVLDGLTGTVGMTWVDSTYSGFSQAVKLPAYRLLNAGINYETKSWKLGVQGKNLTNEKYFRANFPDLFGSSVVLPEVPRNWTASLTYKF
ncbi:TonB-dependent siderophore receptor [Solimonas variicoloris]|uniref:TonB-dependent siderophore receptor n=1 Tax=Solimonas variicoloris TaxID=254408 RepID=UPI0003A61C7D|nr:TonB-dependent receptor [Solimonas variicoloris]